MEIMMIGLAVIILSVAICVCVKALHKRVKSLEAWRHGREPRFQDSLIPAQVVADAIRQGRREGLEAYRASHHEASGDTHAASQCKEPD